MANSPAFIIDGLFDASLGMNEGIQPLLLPRNQLASAFNCTVRGTFVTHRPARRKIPLTYASDAIGAAFESGLFQGGCFYNSDFGAASILAAISGRLFQLVLNGAAATVAEQTILNDANPAGQPQAWLWQSENYVIWNDGQSLPVFFDGTSSKRSTGDSSVLATTSLNFTAPNVGSSVTITLSAPYAGAYNIPVLIGGSRYQLLSSSAVYQATLTNINDTAGAVQPVNALIVSRPSAFGVISGTFNYGGPFPAGTSIQIQFTFPVTVPVGTQFTLAGSAWTFNSLSTNSSRINATNASPVSGVLVTDGQVILRNPSTAPNVTVATLSQTFTVPAKNATVTATLTAPYAGVANALVYIGDKQYTIIAVAPTPATTVSVVNVDDVAGTNRIAPIDVLSIPQLPAGRMGAYGMGRNWMSLIDGISFIAGDIVGGSSGTATFSGRDAVLNVSENTFLNGGGVFRVPGTVGDIRAMRFSATLDASLGQGPLQVLTPTTVFSCNAPVDRLTWQNLTNPILTQSLITGGGQGQDSSVIANSDIYMRSIDGLRSQILARRDFNRPANVPLSREVQPTLNQDNKSLLPYSRALVFDNRLLITNGPVSSAQGVYHPSAAVMNFDPISTLQTKSNPVYDGFWTGLNVLQFVTGLDNGVQRAFAFTLNLTTAKIELWELLATDAQNFDNVSDRIAWEFSSASLFKELPNKGPNDLCALCDGEIYVDNVLGQVDFQAFFKPDEYAQWVPWYAWSIQNNNAAPRSFPRMGLTDPSTGKQYDPSTNKPLWEAYTFQFRLVVTGHCRFLGARFKATPSAAVQFAKPLPPPPAIS